MPRDVTRKAHSNQKTRGDVLLLPALPIASRGSLGVGASEQQDSQCQTRSRFCLAPVKQVDSTHSKHTRTHIGTHGAPMGGYHTDTQAHRHTGTQTHTDTHRHRETHKHTGTQAHRHTDPCTREQISGCRRGSPLYLIVSLCRSGEWARNGRGLSRASNGAPQAGQGAHEQCSLILRTQPALQQFSSSLAAV